MIFRHLGKSLVKAIGASMESGEPVIRLRARHALEGSHIQKAPDAGVLVENALL